ncbi:hypothetical protein D3C87_1323720 [compost metagenome]
MALPGFPGLVTCVIATNKIPMIAAPPIGKAFPMIATIVPIKIPSNLQALTSMASGWGITNQKAMVTTKAIAAGTIFT